MNEIELPVFRGYTVDEKRREFRRTCPGLQPEVLSFDSLDGAALWLDLLELRLRAGFLMIATMSAITQDQPV